MITYVIGLVDGKVDNDWGSSTCCQFLKNHGVSGQYNEMLLMHPAEEGWKLNNVTSKMIKWANTYGPDWFTIKRVNAKKVAQMGVPRVLQNSSFGYGNEGFTGAFHVKMNQKSHYKNLLFPATLCRLFIAGNKNDYFYAHGALKSILQSTDYKADFIAAITACDFYHRSYTLTDRGKKPCIPTVELANKLWSSSVGERCGIGLVTTSLATPLKIKLGTGYNSLSMKWPQALWEIKLEFDTLGPSEFSKYVKPVDLYKFALRFFKGYRKMFDEKYNQKMK